MSCFNLLAISKMRFLSLLLLMLANCFVCTSLFAKYTTILAALFGFQIFFLSTSIFPLFPCLSFHVDCIVPTSLFHYQVSFFRGDPLRIHPYISTATSRSLFLIYSKALSISAGICWHFIDIASSNSFCTKVSFKFQVFLLGAMRMGLTGFADTTKSETSNLCCVMNFSLLITFASLMFFSCAVLTRMKSICLWLSPDEKVISLLLFLRKKVLVIESLLATQKSRMRNPSWFLMPYPLPPSTP